LRFSDKRHRFFAEQAERIVAPFAQVEWPQSNARELRRAFGMRPHHVRAFGALHGGTFTTGQSRACRGRPRLPFSLPVVDQPAIARLRNLPNRFRPRPGTRMITLHAVTKRKPIVLIVETTPTPRDY